MTFEHCNVTDELFTGLLLHVLQHTYMTFEHRNVTDELFTGLLLHVLQHTYTTFEHCNVTDDLFTGHYHMFYNMLGYYLQQWTSADVIIQMHFFLVC